MRMAIGLARPTITAQRMALRIRNRQIEAPSRGPILSLRFSPRYRPIRIVTAIAQPVTVKVTTLRTLLPVETPERPAVVPKRPTTRRSTAPYMACSTRDPKIGSINRSILAGMLPAVKSLDPFFLTVAAFSLIALSYLFPPG